MAATTATVGTRDKVYLFEHLLGVFVFSGDGDLIYTGSRKGDEVNIAENIWRRINEGHDSLVDDALREIESRFGKDNVQIVVEDDAVARYIASKGFDVRVESDGVFRSFRSRVPELYVSQGIVEGRDKYVAVSHRIALEVARRELRKYAGKRDLLAIQSIRAIDDIDKTLNLFAARLREWYSIHFPELDELIDDHIRYARIVSELGTRDNYSIQSLRKIGLGENLAKRVTEAAMKSMGADLSEFDIKPIQTLARIMLQLHELRSYLTNYTSNVVKEVAPNVNELVGPLLAARLLSLAGSLEELAKLPASTIQVLGAEKALFRALRTGGRPPKHGIIFQFPEIHRSPRWQRGKIARALATKLAIAARIDFFTGRFLGDRLKKSLMERIEEIKKLYPKPPKREREERGRRFPRRKKKGHRR